MLYKHFYRRLEQVRWDMEKDIPWEKIEKDKVTPGEVQLVQYNAMIEWTAVDAAEAFLRDFSHDSDFSSFVSIWFYEEMKHFLLLKRYAEHFHANITEENCQSMRKHVPPAPPFNILTVHFIGEFRLASWYNSLAKIFKEPVLKYIYRLIASDEIRHGVCYFQYLKKMLAQNPRELLMVFKTSLYMLRQPVHPTMITGTVSAIKDVDKIYHYLNEVLDPREKENASKRVFSYLSKLSEKPIQSLQDLLDQLKVLRASLKPA